MEADERGARLGAVRIAPNVLATIAAINALAVPGVARLADAAGGVGRLMPRDRGHGGVRVEVHAGQVSLQIHVVAKLGANLVQVAEGVQRQVCEAIPNMVGMTVAQVEVLIDDVE